MPRYAVYYVPEKDSPLWKFGSSAVGYDAYTGREVAFPDHSVYRNPDARTWTEDPRKYGFHGTLKAPFELRDGADETALIVLARDFAARRKSVTLPKLEVGALGRFVALLPGASSPVLGDLAADCVRDFDPFRAPLSAEDRARRLKSPLSERQVAYLDQWGYPYVMEEFRFHMTLSGALDERPRLELLRALRELYEPFAAPFVLDGIGIFKQDGRDAPFMVLERFPFRS